MNIESLIALIKNHKGKFLGILIGVFFGALVIRIGFWYSLFITVCIVVGYYLGSLHDKGERLASFFDKIMSRKLK